MTRFFSKVFLSFTLFILTALCLVSCGNDGYKVTFWIDGKIYYETEHSGNGDLKMPSNPDVEGCIFDGWFVDAGKWSVPFDEHYFNGKAPSFDVSVYAKITIPHNHTPGDYITVEESTCEKEGVQIKKCTVCDELLVTESIPKAEHTEVIIEGQPATDTTDGYGDSAYCSRCHTITRSLVTIPARIQGTDIDSDALTVDGSVLSISLPNSTLTFSIVNNIKTYYKASVVISYDKEMSQPISDSVNLAEGDNEFYVTVSFAEESTQYTVKIRRRPIFTVSFNTNGGSAVDEVTVEEGMTIVSPTAPTKAGYDFSGWDRNLTSPITESFTANAEWTPRADTAYKIIYYTEKADGEYSVYDEKFSTGTTNASAEAEIVSIDDFEYDEKISTPTGIILPDGSLVLEIYYKRVAFSITFDTGCDIVIAKQAVEKGALITEPEAPSRSGVTFKGWFLDGKEWNFDTDTASDNITLVAKWTAIVTFVSNDEVMKTVEVEVGTTVTTPKTLPDGNMHITSWLDSYDNVWDFKNTPVMESITLKANWELFM